MRQAEIAERLTAIEALIRQALPPERMATALKDIEDSYGLAGQLVEVAHAQREQLEALISRLDRVIDLLTAHDTQFQAHDAATAAERIELRELMVQLRELARKQVRGQADLVLALGESGAWNGEERRNSIADRRRV